MTVAEIAAYLGMTTSGVRNVISRKRIPAKGRGHFKARLYDIHDILRHTGTRDRR